MILSQGQSDSPDQIPPFDVVFRGYEREQVEQHLQDLVARLAAAEQAREAAEQRIRTVEEELHSVRARSDADRPISQDSFGFRAEKILRMAEHEAADVRSRAAKEATVIVEQARAEAEKHRHEVEQALIARSAELDQEAAKRTVAIQEREQQAKALLAGARDESARIADDARTGADKLAAEAEARAEQLRKRTEDECRRRREAAEQELRRIGDLRNDVRTDISRLYKLLGAEVSAEPGTGEDAATPRSGDEAPGRARPGSGPAGTAAATRTWTRPVASTGR